MVQVGSQKYIRAFSLSYFVNSQIWLNQLKDDQHLCCISKLKKKTVVGTLILGKHWIGFFEIFGIFDSSEDSFLQ
jgi:hypothetical protein